MKVIQKYQVHMKDEGEKKRVDELKHYLDEKIAENQMVLRGQAERRTSSCAIQFGTTTTKVLTSKTVMAKIYTCDEWKSSKKLKKNDLIAKMIEKYGFTIAIWAKKLPELKEMVVKYLLEREKELVDVYQKELDDVTIPLPSSITNFFWNPTNTEEEKREDCDESDDGNNCDEMEKDILAFLNRRMNDGEDKW